MEIMIVNWSYSIARVENDFIPSVKNLHRKPDLNIEEIKEMETDLLQDNVTQLNKHKLESVRRTLYLFSTACSIQYTEDFVSMCVYISAEHVSISVISHWNREENSISDFRLQNEMYRYIVLDVACGFLSFLVFYCRLMIQLALTYTQWNALNCLKGKKNWISIAAMFMKL